MPRKVRHYIDHIRHKFSLPDRVVKLLKLCETKTRAKQLVRNYRRGLVESFLREAACNSGT